MLNNEEFSISPQCLFEFKDSLRNLVEELGENEGLFSQTLREYLNELGEILFLEDDDETRIVRFMAPISDYLINEEFRYSLHDEEEDLESDI
jgi:hypothetical protein